jgi:exodeoxyribonuclease-3
VKVTTLNINSVRNGAKKGFFDWMHAHSPDVVCLQETKVKYAELTDPVFHPKGYHLAFSDAEKPGYSGVAMYAREKPHRVHTCFGHDVIDKEGRFVRMDFEHVSVVSLYMPSGTTGEVRQAVKYELMAVVGDYMQQVLHEKTPVIFCGDFNIAHKVIDIKNAAGNKKHSGFLPQERAWLDTVFDEWGFVDAFRVVNQEKDQYTWWSNRGQAYAKNVGWRIDYQIVTPDLKKHIVSADIYKDTRFSDHAPLTVKYSGDFASKPSSSSH